jgi:hypothetical protein
MDVAAEMPQERPETVPVGAAPPWARDAVARLRSAQGSRRTGSFARETIGLLWFLPDSSSAFWTRVPARSPWRVVPIVLLGSAVLALCGAVIALRETPVPPWVWSAGAAAAALGAAAMPATSARRRASEGLLITRDGLVRTDGADVQLAARADVHDVQVVATALYVLWGAPTRRWRLGRARDDEVGRAWLEESAARFRAWLRTGERPVAPTATTIARPGAAAWIAESAAYLAAALVPAGFLWLTAVMPGASASGRAATTFVDHVVRRELDAAYGMLSVARRAAVSRAQFEASLPEPLRRTTGFEVNGIHGGSGPTCIDGHLQGVGWMDSGVAFDIVTESGGERIDAWFSGTCKTRR